MGKTIVILQARTGSTRLPNKMILPFYKNKTVLEILIERIKAALDNTGIDIVVATTTKIQDDPIEQLGKELNVKVYRGSENDVLNRFIGAADAFGGDKVVRVCADNVFLDMESLKILAEYLSNAQYDYVSFKKQDGTPSILTHYGFFCEGVKVDALKHVDEHTSEKIFHEHVTNRIYTAPDIYSVKLFPIGDVIPGLEEHNYLRLTLDTQDDFEVQQQIYTYLNDNGLPITPANIINYLDKLNPDLYKRMAKTIKENTK